jgi:hypothetical protein
MFEFITKQCFVECLMYYCDIPKKVIKQFIEYAKSLKSTDSFDPLIILTQFYKEVEQNVITKMICSYIKDSELQIIVISFLIKNNMDRIQYVKNILKNLNIYTPELSIIPTTIKKRLKQETKQIEEYSKLNISILSNTERKTIISVLQTIVKNNKKFDTYCLFYTIMFCDRFFIRLNRLKELYPVLKNNYDIVSIILLFLSSVILKNEIFKASEIVSTTYKYYSKIYTFEKVAEYLKIILDTLDYSLYQFTPDILLNYLSIEKEFNELYTIYMKYPLINENVLSIANKLIEAK